MARQAIREFFLANPIYRNALVSFYTVSGGERTNTLATLYSSSVVTDLNTVGNPVRCNSEGRFRTPVYYDVPLIAVVTGINIPSHETGIIEPGTLVENTTFTNVLIEGDLNVEGDTILEGDLQVEGDTILGDLILGGSTTVHLGTGDTFTITNLAGETVVQVTEAGDTIIGNPTNGGNTTINLGDGDVFHVTNADASSQFDGDVNIDGILTVGGDNILDLIAAAGSAQGGFSSSGLIARNNIANPNTQLDISASAIVVLNPATSKSTYISAPANQTNNTSTAGPAAGGRDQAGAFGVSSWIHFYLIYNSTTLDVDSISSAVAPPTGPTLPTGYDAWCYVGPVRFNGASQLESIYITGAFAYRQAAVVGNAVSNGTAAVETAVSIVALVPPNAQVMEINVLVGAAGGGAAANEWATFIGFITGTDFSYVTTAVGAAASTNTTNYLTTTMPNLSQSMHYSVERIGGSTGAGNTYITIVGYSIPNNG